MTDTEVVPRKPDRPPAGKPPLVDAATADELLARAQAEGVELLGPVGLLSQVTKAVLERALDEELTGHLGYEKHDPAGSGNSRNGSTGKTLLTEVGGSSWTCRAIATGRSAHRSCARARPAWTGSTTASSPSMRGA
jgi:hypothetical protein